MEKTNRKHSVTTATRTGDAVGVSESKRFVADVTNNTWRQCSEKLILYMREFEPVGMC